MEKLYAWWVDAKCNKQIPPIVSALIIVNLGVLIIPEKFWLSMGVDAANNLRNMSELLQYQINDMENKNAVYVFWVLLPVVSLINTLVIATRYNTCGFSAYLMRRNKALESEKKGILNGRSGMVIACIVIIVAYLITLFYGRTEPVFLPEYFLTTNNRLALATIHGLAVLYVLPMMFTVIVTELRAVFLRAK